MILSHDNVYQIDPVDKNLCEHYFNFRNELIIMTKYQLMFIDNIMRIFFTKHSLNLVIVKVIVC